jgi:hypothetical protein
MHGTYPPILFEADCVRILYPIHLKSVPRKASGRTNDQEQHVSSPMLERTLSENL